MPYFQIRFRTTSDRSGMICSQFQAKPEQRRKPNSSQRQQRRKPTMYTSVAQSFDFFTTQQLIPSFMQNQLSDDFSDFPMQKKDERALLPMQQFISTPINFPSMALNKSDNTEKCIGQNPISYLPFQSTLDEKKELILPPYFKPGPYSVIIGRGKECRGAIGNRRLRVLASRFLEKYADAPNKATKSRIVATIVAMMREACPLGAFVRLRQDGQWYEVKEAVASEKVGYTMRELLGEMYKSSSRSRVLKRQKSDNSVSEGEKNKQASSSSCEKDSQQKPHFNQRKI